MHKEVAQQLHEAANVAATIFSKPDRPLNPGETFHGVREKPLSENTAAVLFKKEPSNKLALAFFYYLNTNGGEWRYFFLTYQHIAGMKQVESLLAKVEEHNYSKNFQAVEFVP